MYDTATIDRSADLAASGEIEQIHADHVSVKRLGHWTSADRYEVRARNGSVVLDLRSPGLPAEVEIRLRLDHAVVKLLLPEEATVEHWDLAWTGRGKVKDAQAASRPKAGKTQRGQSAQERGQAREQGLVDTADGAATFAAEHVGMGVRHVRLVGDAESSEVRINRGGVAMLAAMCSREYVEELRQARKEGTYPTIDDPTRPAKAVA